MPRGVYDRNTDAQASNRLEEDSAPALPSARAAETRRERRRRDDGDLDRMARMKLAIPRNIQEQADREGKVLRWMIDVSGRMQEVEANDWDAVPGISTVAASRDDETQMRLCWKYKDWYDADQRKKTNLLDEREKAIERGAKTESDDPRQPGVHYTPAGNKISREQGL